MMFEIDHVLFATEDLEGAERLLAQAGLEFTVRRIHAGQGTRNACAPFENAFFELLGATDDGELRSALVRPLGLDERIRWRATGACPFGICLRPASGDAAPTDLDLNTWSYQPPYVKPGSRLLFASAPGRFDEPLVFVRVRPGEARGAPRSSLRIGGDGTRRELTGVRIGLPRPPTPLSAGIRWLHERGLPEFATAATAHLELEWDHSGAGVVRTLDPALPIVLRW
jgi:hypothetical protein